MDVPKSQLFCLFGLFFCLFFFTEKSVTFPHVFLRSAGEKKEAAVSVHVKMQTAESKKPVSVVSSEFPLTLVLLESPSEELQVPLSLHDETVHNLEPVSFFFFLPGRCKRSIPEGASLLL